MPTPPLWQLHLLGQPRLISPAGEPRRCDRKPLAVLTYLAVEGSTSRSRLAGLLWPDTLESTARNNLVQLLRRMKRTYGDDLVTAGDTLELSPLVQVMLPEWFRGSGTPQGEVTPQPGELLEGVDFDDMPDLADWLLSQREHIGAAQTAWLNQMAAALEEREEWSEAIRVAQTLLQLNPLSEDHYRLLMRLQYLHHDRSAALLTFQRCQQVLMRELGVEPMPVTTLLAEEIERGAVDVRAAPVKVQLPLSVRRPPTLIGRTDPWLAMERGWNQGQFIILSGAPGVGKSRLMHDFVATKGKVLRVEAKPGDMLVPYSTTARNLLTILAAHPEFRLKPWQRRALAPLLPDLLEDGDLDVPNVAPLSAVIQEIFQMGTQDVQAIVYEDMQYADPASIEAGLVLISSAFPLGQGSGVPMMLCTVRSDELNASTQDVFRQMTLNGLATQIALCPLAEADIFALLDELEVPLTQETRRRLAQFAGGNPLYLLETVRNMIENGTAAEHAPERFPVTDKVSRIIDRRLERLSRGALITARAASVLQSDFNLELISDVLGAQLFDVAGHWEELYAAQLVMGDSFAHDLVYETILMGISDPVRRLLHRGAARALTRAGAPKARIAAHWHNSGLLREAAPLYVEAAREAMLLSRMQEADHFYQLAIEMYEQLDDPAQAAAVRVARAALSAPAANG
ncbi:BTAD domain-containing putative transcriptional regulator [Deinococcus sonorensis]|uniref:BTAD domain-containing putative transcriptional regulator n=1 Tax=Deinococcus sonorensis KR-87 TaxID=694439 RepID=A0AAU7U722_9DEIO